MNPKIPLEKGIVLKSTGSWCTVKTTTGKIIPCKMRGKLRIKEVKTTNPVAVGDLVEYVLDKGVGSITNIIERKNYIIRKSSNLSHEAHVIAANVDQALLIVSLVQPETTIMFIDRFLVSAEAYSIPAILVFNKIDLYDGALLSKLWQLKNTYEKIGYQCIAISGLKKNNIDVLKILLKDKISVLSGNSGVGKSTIINSVDPSLDLKIREVSDYHKKGKHTTTFSEMFELNFGGYIIDTPGVKGFGIVDIEKNELFHFFPEMFSTSKHCRFYNCTHVHEPGCAVKEAVENGGIAGSRYINYLSIMEDKDNKYRM